MFRTVHTLLLIASLLACPFRCAGVVSAEAAEMSSCSCCVSRSEAPSRPVSEAEPVQQEQVPSAPIGDCGCSDCLCKGAVLTDDSLVQDTLVAELWVLDVLPRSFSLAAADGLTAGLADEGQPLILSAAGRSLRLIIQSLQI